MKYGFVALAVMLMGMLGNAPVAAQACRGSCTNAKNVCIQNSRGGADICNSRFRDCMATGTWTRTDRYKGAQITSNLCKR